MEKQENKVSKKGESKIYLLKLLLSFNFPFLTRLDRVKVGK